MADRHAQTHDVRRERATNPTGPEPTDESFAEQMGERTDRTPGGHAVESRSGAADKTLRRRFQDLRNDELATLAILEPGTRLEQGGVYLDLNDREMGPFQAMGGQEATKKHRIIAKRDTDHEMWNRLVGQDETVDVVRPETSDTP